MCPAITINITSPNSTNQTTSLNRFDRIAENLAAGSTVYYTPLLIFLGVVGNLISIFVFYKSKLRLQSTGLYLSALAISDTVFLLQLLPPWLNTIEFTGIFHHPGFCQVFVYLSYSSCFLSAWLVVAFTVERFVAVMYPLRRNMLCTVARARYIILALVVVALTINLPILKFASPTKNDCNLNYDYLEHAERFNMFDTALSFTVPLTVIIIMNTWIMVAVYRMERARRQLLKAGEGRPRGRDLHPPPPLMPRSQHRVTRMLLAVSTVFVGFNMPAYVMRMLSYAYSMDVDEYSGRWAAFSQLALMSFNTNYGINFILYCLIGRNFRQSLCQSLPFRNRVRRAAAVRRNRPARASSGSTSFVSGTEANSNCATCVSTVATRSNVRRHRSDPVLKRWTFDNSRQRCSDARPREDTETIEMHDLAPDHSNNNNVISRQHVVRQAPQPRTIPNVLFPYRNLIVPRSRNPAVVESVLYG